MSGSQKAERDLEDYKMNYLFMLNLSMVGN